MIVWLDMDHSEAKFYKLLVWLIKEFKNRHRRKFEEYVIRIKAETGQVNCNYSYYQNEGDG